MQYGMVKVIRGGVMATYWLLDDARNAMTSRRNAGLCAGRLRTQQELDIYCAGLIVFYYWYLNFPSFLVFLLLLLAKFEEYTNTQNNTNHKVITHKTKCTQGYTEAQNGYT